MWFTRNRNAKIINFLLKTNGTECWAAESSWYYLWWWWYVCVWRHGPFCLPPGAQKTCWDLSHVETWLFRNPRGYFLCLGCDYRQHQLSLLVRSWTHWGVVSGWHDGGKTKAQFVLKVSKQIFYQVQKLHLSLLNHSFPYLHLGTDSFSLCYVWSTARFDLPFMSPGGIIFYKTLLHVILLNWLMKGDVFLPWKTSKPNQLEWPEDQQTWPMRADQQNWACLIYRKDNRRQTW